MPPLCPLTDDTNLVEELGLSGIDVAKDTTDRATEVVLAPRRHCFLVPLLPTSCGLGFALFSFLGSLTLCRCHLLLARLGFGFGFGIIRI
jgi:hypothetical protein